MVTSEVLKLVPETDELDTDVTFAVVEEMEEVTGEAEFVMISEVLVTVLSKVVAELKALGVVDSA